MNEVIPMLVNELQSKDEAEQANESTKENDSAKDMSLYQCLLCGYVYDPAIGDPENGIAQKLHSRICQKTGAVQCVVQQKQILKSLN